MLFWEREPLRDIIDEDSLVFSDPGPLNSPISSFTLRRTEKFDLTLETVCGKKAVVNELLRDENAAEARRAEIKGITGLPVRLTGVISETVQTRENYRQGISELREKARVFGVEADFQKAKEAHYTIDWLENIGRHYCWPDLVKTDHRTDFTRAYERDAECLVLTDRGGHRTSGRSALRLAIGGHELFLTSNPPLEGTEQVTPGYILYSGTPDEQTRRKIRTVLSFALGMYLVYLGHSTYTANWRLASFRAVSGYSMDMRAFELHVLPPTWLGTAGHNDLDPAKVLRLASGLFAHYDELDFGNLSWGYWHAMCAPLHIKAVHFGAVIEALQRNYLAAHKSEFSERVVGDNAKWGAVVEAVTSAINSLTLSDDQKALLCANVGRLNQMPRAAVTEQVLQHLGLVLGEDEKQAWKRRHDAAHGNPMTPGREREVIRDSHLLRVIFNRMILRIVDGSDHYFDYTARPSPAFPIRALRDPVPSLSAT